MAGSNQSGGRGSAPHCAACLEVIGVYEPAVAVFDGIARHTSRAAEPGLPLADERCYHLGCYTALADELQGTSR
jgi:hypothetical protein